MPTGYEYSVLRTITKAEAVHQEIRWRILSGALVPGATVNQEELARELGVSATPVREALRRLESEGLVRFMAHTTVRVPLLSLRELDELYAIRLSLDPLAARLATTNAKAEEIEAIQTVLVEAAPDGQGRDRFDSNRAFHRAVYAASGNLELVALLERLWDRTERYRYILVTTREDEPAAARDHSLIAEAIAGGNADLAGRLLATHVQRSHEIIGRVLRKWSE